MSQNDPDDEFMGLQMHAAVLDGLQKSRVGAGMAGAQRAVTLPSSMHRSNTEPPR